MAGKRSFRLLLISLFLMATNEISKGGVPSLTKTLNEYTIKRCVELTRTIQKLSDEERENALNALADDPDKADDIYFLCQMLFIGADGKELRGPMIGQPEFVIDDVQRDDNDQLLLLYKGIPILVVKDAVVAGTPESPKKYLRYCLSHGKFRQDAIKQYSDEEIQKIFQEFKKEYATRINDKKWIDNQGKCESDAPKRE